MSVCPSVRLSLCDKQLTPSLPQCYEADLTPVITYVMDPEMEEEVERILALAREIREHRDGGGESRDAGGESRDAGGERRDDVLPMPVFANTNDGVEHDDDEKKEKEIG